MAINEFIYSHSTYTLTMIATTGTYGAPVLRRNVANVSVNVSELFSNSVLYSEYFKEFGSTQGVVDNIEIDFTCYFKL